MITTEVPEPLRDVVESGFFFRQPLNLFALARSRVMRDIAAQKCTNIVMKELGLTGHTHFSRIKAEFEYSNDPSLYRYWREIGQQRKVNSLLNRSTEEG